MSCKNSTRCLSHYILVRMFWRFLIPLWSRNMWFEPCSLVLFHQHVTIDAISQCRVLKNMANMSSYPGYFLEPCWLPMGPPEIPRVTWQVWGKCIIWDHSALPINKKCNKQSKSQQNYVLVLWDIQCSGSLAQNCDNFISMAQCTKDVTPLLTQWSYVFLASTHWYELWWN